MTTNQKTLTMFTTQQLLNQTQRIQDTMNREIKMAKDKAETERKNLLDAYAKDNARFKAGEVIMENHPTYGPVSFTIIRMETVSAFLEGTTPVITYRGRELYPDFAESYDIYGSPRFETLYDRGNASDITRLEKPLYASYTVVNAEGKEFPTNSYRETFDIARRELTGTKTKYVIRYGITPSGERKEIQKIYNIDI